MMEILPESIQHWDDCLYGGIPVFGTNKTSDVVDVDASRLRALARSEHRLRSCSPHGDNYYRELDALPVSGWSVLELGCGAGVDSLYFADRGAFVTACDIVPSNVVVTRKVLEPYDARVVLLRTYDDLVNLGTFDMVYSHGCLHHIPDVSASGVVERLCQVLRPDGVALVMVYTKYFYPSVNYHASFGHPEGPFSRGYSENELCELFGSTMMLVSYRVVNIGTFSWALFRKLTPESGEVKG